MKINTVDYGSIKNRNIITASACINDSYFDSWSFGWAIDGQDKPKIIKEYSLTDEKISQLHNWVDAKFEQNRIGWSNIFYSLDELNEYKETFFKDRKDLIKLGLSFSETEISGLIDIFEPQGETDGEIGLRSALKQKIPENQNGKFIGYDIVGVELDGSFHTIHCHDLQKDLEEKFGLEFNANGLMKECKNWKEISNFCNDESNGLEPVPWFYCKVKIYE